MKLNGYDLAVTPEDKYTTIICVAASDISEDEFAQWIWKNLKDIKSLNHVIMFFFSGLDVPIS
jgi:death on curing protein